MVTLRNFNSYKALDRGLFYKWAKFKNNRGGGGAQPSLGLAELELAWALKPQDSFGRFVKNCLDLQKVDHTIRKHH